MSDQDVNRVDFLQLRGAVINIASALNNLQAVVSVLTLERETGNADYHKRILSESQKAIDEAISAIGETFK